LLFSVRAEKFAFVRGEVVCRNHWTLSNLAIRN
jgi:hypothetical protein